jgi:glycosyltransferase involved in cell wall biosynthesis
MEDEACVASPVAIASTQTAPSWPELEVVADMHRDGRIVFVYLGAHGRVNALHVVLRAFGLARSRSHTPLSLLMVGDGPEKPALQGLAAQLALSDIHWLGPVPKARVPRLLRSVDVGVVHATSTPVYRFGISFNKLFDYMAAGLPVAFACTAWNDPVKATGAGVSCLPDDPMALADAMVRLAEASPDERRAMGEAGRAFVAEAHDMARLGRDFVDLVSGPPKDA